MQILKILTTGVVLCAILACGEKPNELEMTSHGTFVESPILYQNKTMLSIVSLCASDNEEVKRATKRLVNVVCGRLLGNGWGIRNVNYPSIKSIWYDLAGKDMYADWVFCIISFRNCPSPQKSSMTVQCGARAAKKPFLSREFDLNISESYLLNEIEWTLAGLLVAARQDAAKLEK
jgi:hypothetical protein